MKQKFILSFVAIVFGVLFASAQNDEKLIVYAGSVEHIKVGADVNIVLMQDGETERSVSMSNNAHEKLDIQLANNSMTIAVASESMKEKPTVFLYVNNLKTLTVESNSTVKTIGVLDTPKVDVFVDGQSTVHLKSNGDIKAHAVNGREIKVKYLSENWLARQGTAKSRARK